MTARLTTIKQMNFSLSTPIHGSRCREVAKRLHAETYNAVSIGKMPSEIVEQVIHHGGAGLSVGERKQLPNLILQKQFDGYQPEFALTVLKNFSKRNRFWHRLLRSLLLEFRSDGPGLEVIRAALRDNNDRLPRSAWDTCEKYGLIEKNPNLNKAATNFLNSTLVDTETFGFATRGQTASKLGSKILIEAARILSEGSAEISQISVFKDFVAPENSLHPSVKSAALVGLVKSASSLKPGENTVEEIQQLIEKNFEDPVINAAAWPSVPDILGGQRVRQECIEITQKWQAFRSINLFFKIIEKVVESDHRHQFPLRKDFWLNYFNQGQVSDAWVILGSQARDYLSQVIDRGGKDYEALRWGRLSGGRSDLCALLIKLGDVTVMEFSHSGSARIWGPNNHRINYPKLHQSRYRADDLRAECPPEQIFRHDHIGNWRPKVSACISRLSGKARRL